MGIICKNKYLMHKIFNLHNAVYKLITENLLFTLSTHFSMKKREKYVKKISNPHGYHRVWITLKKVIHTKIG